MLRLLDYFFDNFAHLVRDLPTYTMLVAYLLVAATCVSFVFSHFVRKADGQVTVDEVLIKRCGTPDMSEEDRVLAEQRLAPFISSSLRGAELDAVATISVPVYFHVITDSGGNGDVTDVQISNQVLRMNEAHKNTTFVFNLQGNIYLAYCLFICDGILFMLQSIYFRCRSHS